MTTIRERAVEAAPWIEFRPDSKGKFDELVARFADGMIHAEMMTDKSLYVGLYWDDGRTCQWWISADKKLRHHHDHFEGAPPRYTAAGIDTKPDEPDVLRRAAGRGENDAA